MKARPHDDVRFMRHAIALAGRGLGRVWPNPAVGCVLVKDHIIVGRGWTQKGGRPHAETVALAAAGDQARGATAYVSLEPCAHTGKTPPCADALVKAGVARVVIGAGDPDPRVAGQGTQKLIRAGLAVTEHVCASEAGDLNRGFFSRITRGRPIFTLKIAASLDGRIALGSGGSKWITGASARAYGHMLRANHDAILVGAGTALADDPGLDCRIPGLEDRSPVRVILDSALRLPVTSRLVQTAQNIPTWIVTEVSDADRTAAYRQCGAEIITMPTVHDLNTVARELGQRGLTRVLVEGGARVHASFIRAGLADGIEYFGAPKVIGSDGLGAIGDLGLARMEDAPHFTLGKIRRFGPDMLASYRKAE